MLLRVVRVGPLNDIRMGLLWEKMGQRGRSLEITPTKTLEN
jgi:hypothetical protein